MKEKKWKRNQKSWTIIKQSEIKLKEKHYKKVNNMKYKNWLKWKKRIEKKREEEVANNIA